MKRAPTEVGALLIFEILLMKPFELELEVEVTVEHLNLVGTVEVLAPEVVSSCANVLLQSDVSTDFPTLLAFGVERLEIIGGSKGTRVGHTLIGSIETNLLGCLPIETNVVGILLNTILSIK